MEKRPLKRNEYLKKLSREHHLGLLFCWKIRQGLKLDVNVGRISEYVQYFWKHHLQPHFQDEEMFLFAPIKDKQVQRALDEHKYIRHHIEELAQYSENNMRKALAKLADNVDDHVRFEERQLFPRLERKLSTEQWEKFDKQIQKHPRSALLDSYEDQFWNI